MFKKYVFILLMIITSLFSAEVNWAKDYHEAMLQAQKEDKVVLFIISRDTCKYCVLLKDTTLKNETVVKVLNEDFISVVAWTNENDFIPDELRSNTPGLPGIWFLQPDGEPMFNPVMGYVKKDRFLEALSIVQEEYKKINKGKK